MDHVTVVSVSGLKHASPDGEDLWGEYWLQRMGISAPSIVFDARLNQHPLAPDVLSKPWLERQARELLEEVKAKHLKGRQLVFFGENLGGIILKRALVLAELNPEYQLDISQSTCACVFLDVPHTAASPHTWIQTLVSLVATSWRPLPRDIWDSIGGLIDVLERTSHEFAQVALRLTLLTVLSTNTLDRSASPSLYLAHERIIRRSSGRGFMFPKSEHVAVDSIISHLRKAALVPQSSRSYLGNLACLNPHVHNGAPEDPVADKETEGTVERLARDVATLFVNQESPVTVLHGPRGAGKRSLLCHTFRELLSKQTASVGLAYFNFSKCSHARRSVSYMLAAVIRQLLSCEPELIEAVGLPMPNIFRYREGALWTQLRSIIRSAKFRAIRVIVGSLACCSTRNARGLRDALFGLRRLAPTRLKILCTMDTELALPHPSDIELDHVNYINMSDLPALKSAEKELQDRLVDILTQESPRFADCREEIVACLSNSEGFLHSSLIAHRIRSAGTVSCPALIRQDLIRVAVDWTHTVRGMVENSQPWVVRAVSWMLFAQRPLRPEELAVAVALPDLLASPVKETESKRKGPPLDDSFIQRDMKADIKRQLGPLVATGNNEIQISHDSIAVALEAWLEEENQGEVARRTKLTHHLVEYLKKCPGQITDRLELESLQSPRLDLLDYARQYWHDHYRLARGNVLPPMATSTADDRLHDAALELFTMPEYRHGLGLDCQSVQNPVLLAAKLGLLDIVVGLMETTKQQVRATAGDSSTNNNEAQAEPTKTEGAEVEATELMAVACKEGHATLVQHFITKITDARFLETWLKLACSRGDEKVFEILLGQFQKVRGSANVPSNLLAEACRAGQVVMVKALLNIGAKIDEPADRPPLHMAVGCGHIDVVNLLLDNGVNTAATPPGGIAQLERCIRDGIGDLAGPVSDGPVARNAADEDGVTALSLAARNGDTEIVKLLLDHSPLPALADLQSVKTGPEDSQDGATELSFPFHQAVTRGHLGVVKLLLDRDSVSKQLINKVDMQGRSALFLALQQDHPDVVTYLLSKGASIDAQEPYKSSPLRQAVLRGNDVVVRALLDRKADPNASKTSDCSPLTDAVIKGYAVITEMLVRAGAEIAKTVSVTDEIEILGEQVGKDWSASHFAADRGCVDAMKVLVSEAAAHFAAARTSSGHTPLHLAVSREEEEIVTILLPRTSQRGLVPDTPSLERVYSSDFWDSSPYGDGVSRGIRAHSTGSSTPRSVSLPTLCDVNARTNEGIVALHIAAAAGNELVANILLASGASIDASDNQGKQAIHYAADAKKNASGMVSLLLKAGAKVWSLARNNMSPLHYAVSRSAASVEQAEKVVQLLLSHGADPNGITSEGVTPLYAATKSESLSIVVSLVKHGADVNAKIGSDGCTALHAAVESGDPEMVSILLDTGADVDIADDLGDTPLHVAARNEHVSIAQLLLCHRASVTVSNKRSITPLQRAVLNGSVELAKVLLEHGANPNMRDEDGDTALTAALMGSPSADMIDLLLHPEHKIKAEVDVLNGRKQTPLMLALRNPELLLQPLINAKPSIEYSAEDKVTVLHKAAAETRPWGIPHIRALLEYARHEGHINIRDRQGLAPIHHATSNADMLKPLCEFGASMEAVDVQGRTPMHLATMRMWAGEFREHFQDFLLPGPTNKVNVPDADGWTPFHWACRINDQSLIELLIENAGTGLDQKDLILKETKHHWSAWAIASFHDCEDNMKALLAALERLRTSGVPGIPLSPPTIQQGQRQNYYCDYCRISYIYGTRFNCTTDTNFDLCFKCHWHRDSTHYPPGHKFSADRDGDGPVDEPVVLAPPSPSQEEREPTMAPESVPQEDPELEHGAPLNVTDGSVGQNRDRGEHDFDQDEIETALEWLSSIRRSGSRISRRSRR